MKQFFLGVATTLLVIVAALGILLLSIGGGADPVAAPTPTSVPEPTQPAAAQPTDLADDETWLGAVELRSQDVVSPDGELVDVVASGSGVRFSEAGLRAETLDIDATVPFETVATQVGEGVTLYYAGAGLAGVQRQVEILGRDITVSATGTVVADNGQLLIEPQTVDLGGFEFINSAASALARNLVTIRQDVPGVPEGMQLTAVDVTEDGYGVELTGGDVTIGR